jgi:adenylate cyclase class IV
VDEMLEPVLGHFVEIKSRTWSRNDAVLKAKLANELMHEIGIAGSQTVTDDYIDVVKLNE